MLVRVVPGQHGAVGNVHQAHGAARMQFASRAYALRPAVGEGELLLVTRGARLRPVPGHALVVEKIAAQLDLGFGHRIVGGDARLGKALRQYPMIIAADRMAGLLLVSVLWFCAEPVPAIAAQSAENSGGGCPVPVHRVASSGLLAQHHHLQLLQHAHRARSFLIRGHDQPQRPLIFE